MGRTQAPALPGTHRQESLAANRRGRPSRTVLATAVGLGLLAGTAISATAAQTIATGPRSASTLSPFIAEPCPCTDPVCRPACKQN
jgi:hypothetical protein